MDYIEVVSQQGTQKLLATETPDKLIEGITKTVRGGMTEEFNDMAWAYYRGVAEQVMVQSDPAFKAFLQFLEAQGVKPSGRKLREDLNILVEPRDLAKNMKLAGGKGGFLYRIDTLYEQRYVLAPAEHVVDILGRVEEVGIDLTHGIIFPGSALVGALFNNGIAPEIIGYRDEPPFSAYREAVIGRFFLDCVSDTTGSTDAGH